MANFEINEDQAALIRELRKLETSDPVHANVYNALFEKLINNDAFLERLANKMIEKSMLCHVLDSVNAQQVLAADVGPKITAIIDGLQEDVNGLNTKITQKSQSEFYAIADVTGVSTGQVADGYHNVSKMSNGQFRYSAHFTCYPSAVPDGNIVGYLPESANPYQTIYEYTYDVIGQRWVRIRIGNDDRSIQLMNLDGTNVTSTQVTLEYHIDF
ncbi:hypothetical protein [Clostridium phage Villandry]|uniref:hypothetical protein n=2 Tax=Bacteria TaxID=2 RepID=UPI000B05131B|nr:hypothetical protein [Enterocloster clostridioformis]WAK79612.1 hypothetical protein [Clostridium phage Villandry]